MVKLNNNDMKNISGGAFIQEMNGKYALVTVVDMYDTKEKAEKAESDFNNKDWQKMPKVFGEKAVRPPMGPTPKKEKN